MKTAKQIKANNGVRTVIECINCGATTYTNNGIISKTSQHAIQRSCVTCTPIHKRLCDQVRGGGVYLFSCTAGFGLQWAETTNKPVLIRSKPKFCRC